MLHEHPRYEQAKAQVCGFGLGSVIVAVFAVRGCVGDRGFEVGFLDVKAREVGRRKVKTLEDAALVLEGSERAVATMGRVYR